MRCIDRKDTTESSPVEVILEVELEDRRDDDSRKPTLTTQYSVQVLPKEPLRLKVELKSKTREVKGTQKRNPVISGETWKG